jgi:hypothetical protein
MAKPKMSDTTLEPNVTPEHEAHRRDPKVMHPTIADACDVHRRGLAMSARPALGVTRWHDWEAIKIFVTASLAKEA